MPVEVALAMLERDGTWLLQLRDDITTIVAPGRWGLFGGHLDPGETPQQALRRELREEINWQAGDLPFWFSHTNPQRVAHFFRTTLPVPLEALRLQEGQDMVLATREELLSGRVWSPRLQESRPLAPSLQCAVEALFSSTLIRPLEPHHWPGTWSLLEPIFRAGETFPHDPGISEAEARRVWVDEPQATYVALDPADGVVGTYYLKPNAPSLGAHVANAGYGVAEAARGRGIGSQLCRHSQQQAQRLGYRAMQFNLVVSTNDAGLHCWRANGFQIVGTLPGAFRHRCFGDVDAYVLFKQLAGF
ncbi:MULTISPECIES: GNAT family N-acetyltransferase [unclassified Synechococcus]|uniref:GNAT family N-acetyltransferase n=1 Tax=unclassified Synechococcus TaxID=2626047 RepID=UPI0028F42474|nr:MULTISPECIES: GNAT family N-acetyltransferase [unclassified Synechococcus]